MPSLDHVVFPVRDAEASLTFYGDLMGFPLVEAFSGDDWDGYPWLMMIFGVGAHQELVCVALRGAPAPDYRGVPVDARHYALACDGPGDLDTRRGKLRAAGIDFWEENHGEQNSIYFPDPDGVILELTWPASPAGRVESSSARLAVRRWAKGAVSA